MDPTFNDKLIKEVQKYDCLYNMESPEFRKANWKNRIWVKISEKLQVKPVVCKRRWKTLRDSYTRMIRAEEKAKRENKPSPTKTFKYANSLKFLDGHGVMSMFSGNRFSSPRRPPSESSSDHNDDGVFNDQPEATKNDQTEDSNIINNTHFSFDEDEVDNVEALDDFDEDYSSNIDASYSKAKYKMEDTEILTSSHDINVLPAEDPLVNRNPTFMFFESLANKVISAGLSQQEVDTIEFAVASVVYKEISNCRMKRSAQKKSN